MMLTAIRSSAFRRSLGAQSRLAHDLTIRPKTGKPIMAAGGGGRSSVSGHVATVFGCTGFVGRYLVNRLANSGTQVVIPFRGEPDEVRHLKLMGDLGQVVPMNFDLRDPESIAECVRHSDTVFNLIGRDFETKNFNFDAVHKNGAQAIAQACADNSVDRLVHVSALNASASSPSLFLRSKHAGELAVRQVFPDATIVRPATIYGAEDRFLIRIAMGMKLHMMANNEAQRLRPVCVVDIVNALHATMMDNTAIGRTYEFYGPEEYTVAQVESIVAELILRRNTRLNLPKPLAMAVARLLSVLPWPTISPDEVRRQSVNDMPSADAATFADLGITPAVLDDMALQFVRGFRDSRYYEMAQEDAVTFRGGNQKGRIYHTTY